MHACVHALTAKWQAHLRVLNITFILVLTKSKVWDNEKCMCVCVCVCARLHAWSSPAIQEGLPSCCSVGAVHRPPCTGWDSPPQVPLNALAWHFDQPASARPGPAKGIFHDLDVVPACLSPCCYFPYFITNVIKGPWLLTREWFKSGIW